MNRKPFYGIDGMNAVIALTFVTCAFFAGAWAVWLYDIERPF